MARKASDLVDEVTRLSAPERAALIEALLESMDPVSKDTDVKWTEEAESRLAAYRSGQLTAVDAEEVLVKLRG